MEVTKLMPFSQGEIDRRNEGFIEAVFADDVSSVNVPAETRDELVGRILRGGYPEVVAREDAGRRAAWFGSYLNTILQRDVRDMAQIEGLTMLPRLLTLLSARASGLLNTADIARLADIPNTTLRRYLALLEMTFLIHLIPAWSANLRTRVVKSPKLTITDSGLMAHLQGLTQERLRERPDTLGPLLENFVATEILKQATWSDRRVSVFHFRSHIGHEVDLVLEDPSGDLVGVEVKAAGSVKTTDFKGLRFLKEAMGARQRNHEERAHLRGSLTRSVCTTIAGRRLWSRTHQTSPRFGRGSPLVVRVLLRHSSLLMRTPGFLAFSNVPAVLVDVAPCLLAHLLAFEELCQQS